MIGVNGEEGNSPRSSPLATEIRRLLVLLRDEVQQLRDEIESFQEERPDDQDSLLTRAQTAERLGISTRLLDDLADQDEIQPVRIKGRVLYEPDEIARFVRSRAGEGSGNE